jgi:hypothetical protein
MAIFSGLYGVLATHSVNLQLIRCESVRYIASNATVIRSGDSQRDKDEMVITCVNVLPQYFSSD